MDKLVQNLDSGFFRGLMSLWIHEDGLIWRHTRTIIAIEAGVLGGAYSVHSSSEFVSIFILILGSILTFILYLIMQHHRKFRDQNHTLLELAGKKLSYQYCDTGTPTFSLKSNGVWFSSFTGRRLFMFSVILLILVNIGMIIWILVKTYTVSCVNILARLVLLMGMWILFTLV